VHGYLFDCTPLHLPNGLIEGLPAALGHVCSYLTNGWRLYAQADVSLLTVQNITSVPQYPLFLRYPSLPYIVFLCIFTMCPGTYIYHVTYRAVTTFFLFLVRAFATGVFQAVYVYTPEVYATNIRARALGLHTSAARIGALLTPFNAQVSIWSAIMPLYTFV
jgi:hypothetical protein